MGTFGNADPKTYDLRISKKQSINELRGINNSTTWRSYPINQPTQLLEFDVAVWKLKDLG